MKVKSSKELNSGYHSQGLLSTVCGDDGRNEKKQGFKCRVKMCVDGSYDW